MISDRKNPDPLWLYEAHMDFYHLYRTKIAWWQRRGRNAGLSVWSDRNPLRVREYKEKSIIYNGRSARSANPQVYVMRARKIPAIENAKLHHINIEITSPTSPSFVFI